MQNKKKLLLSGVYDYKDKLNVWKSYATRNIQVSDCEKCEKVHARKSVLLENGSHVCWFCWIRKGSNYGLVVPKPKQSIPKSNNETKKKTEIMNDNMQNVFKNNKFELVFLNKNILDSSEEKTFEVASKGGDISCQQRQIHLILLEKERLRKFKANQNLLNHLRRKTKQQ